MGDFKCNSGIPADKTATTAEDNNIYNSNTGSENYPDENISDRDMGRDNYSKNRITDSDNMTPGYSKNNITDSHSEQELDTTGSASDCGCGSGTGSMDDMEYPDGDNPAIIYSETVVFTEPFDYDSADSKPATSDLIEDEQEGSEFVGGDSSRPMC